MTQLDQDATASQPVAHGVVRRRAIRPLVLAVPVALLSLVGACGSSSSPPANGPAAAGSSASASPSSSSAGGATAGATAGGASAGVLTGSVGEGDAYVITLMDSTGAPVTSLKAGSYTVKVKDASKIHDFHLTGPGVDQKTTVPEITESTWTVTLQAGTYTFKCDPHPKMTGSFTVT